jgi:hypothetical protein
MLCWLLLCRAACKFNLQAMACTMYQLNAGEIDSVSGAGAGADLASGLAVIGASLVSIALAPELVGGAAIIFGVGLAVGGFGGGLAIADGLMEFIKAD